MKKIKVQLDFNISRKTHSLYHSFFNNPPKGVEYIKSDFKIINEKNYSLLGKIYNTLISIFPFLSKFHQKITDFLRKDSGADLSHITFHLGNSKKPCVVDYETAYSFINYDERKKKKSKKRVIKKLNKKNIKYLLPIHNEALKSFELYFRNYIKKPQKVIYPTIFIPEKNRKKVKKENKIIFISTSNNLEEKAFLIKGGLEILKAFKRLAKKHSKWEFLILGKIPESLKEKFPKNLILNSGVPREEMWKLFNKCKIFVQPCYQAPAMSFIEAMWFKLPIISYNCWGNGEFIDKNNGILLNPEEINHVDENNVPFYSKEILKQIKNNSEKNAKKIEKAVEKLIKNEKLRKKLGEEGFKKVSKGRFSIEKRNKELRKVYEEALKK